MFFLGMVVVGFGERGFFCLVVFRELFFLALMGSGLFFVSYWKYSVCCCDCDAGNFFFGWFC